MLTFTNVSRSQDDGMKKWMEYMTPSDAHKSMSKCSGTYKAKISMWMDPKAEPTKSEGTATFEMVLGGRYMTGKFSGNMMGMPFEGMSLDGYDNITKKYTNVWIDNMGTGTTITTGTYDEVTKTITYTGESVNPMTGGMMKIRQTSTFNADGSMSMDMFTPDASGNEYKMMHIDFTK